MSRGRRPRDNLEARGNYRKAKTISRGFGVVRMLTSASQRDVLETLTEADITHNTLRRKPPFHATIIGFVGMSRREQCAFHAGLSVSRLEEQLENGVRDESPRQALSVKLGAVVAIGNLIYSKIEDVRVSNEQLQLAGQVALHGISLAAIDRRVVAPHMTIGYAQQGSPEQLREEVEIALTGKTIALQRWDVYPERYA